MTYLKLKKYLTNCFLLLIPVLVWNVIFRRYSPEFFHPKTYWEGVHPVIKILESILLFFVLVTPLFMPLKIKRKVQKTGLFLYFTGLAGYLLAWRPLVLYPDGSWSNDLAGFIAPALSFMLILIGIALIGDRLFFKFPYKKSIYIVISCLYILFHISHIFISHSAN